jgi:predicted GIY-YIG superfamily endonuclease
MAGYGGQSPLMKQFWYLKCIDGSIYTGCTNDLEDRIKRHNSGQVIATRNNLPVEIVTYLLKTT